MRVHEEMDLRDRATNYEVPVLDNPISFAEAHARMSKVSLSELSERRETAAREVLAMLEPQGD